MSRMRKLISRRNKAKGMERSNARIYDTEHGDNSGQYDSLDNKDKLDAGFFNTNAMGNMSQAQINAALGIAVDSSNAPTPGQGGIFDTVSKNGNGGGIFTKMKKTVENFFSSPLSLLNKTLDDIDRGLYTIIYGSDEEQGKDKSIVGATINSIKKTFGTFTEWMKKKYHKIFGDEGITGTKFYKKGKEKVKELAGYLVGKKDKNGVRSGGVLSESFNSLVYRDWETDRKSVV